MKPQIPFTALLTFSLLLSALLLASCEKKPATQAQPSAQADTPAPAEVAEPAESAQPAEEPAPATPAAYGEKCRPAVRILAKTARSSASPAKKRQKRRSVQAGGAFFLTIAEKFSIFLYISSSKED